MLEGKDGRWKTEDGIWRDRCLGVVLSHASLEDDADLCVFEESAEGGRSD